MVIQIIPMTIAIKCLVFVIFSYLTHLAEKKDQCKCIKDRLLDGLYVSGLAIIAISPVIISFTIATNIILIISGVCIYYKIYK